MAKSKLKSILVKLMSGAGTGYFYVSSPYQTACTAPAAQCRVAHRVLWHARLGDAA
jgi:hypothetical protein